MSARGAADRERGEWNHRRLGLGRTVPSGAATHAVDVMLDRVGARRPLTRDEDPAADFLVDFARWVDEACGATDVARPDPITSDKTRKTVLAPLMAAAAVVTVVGSALVLTHDPTTVDVSTSASVNAEAQTQDLLHHAGRLLSQASNLPSVRRSGLVAEAKADLDHVSTLLPEVQPRQRQKVQAQLRRLATRRSALQPPTTRPATTPATPAGRHRAAPTPLPTPTSTGLPSSAPAHRQGTGTRPGADIGQRQAGRQDDRQDSRMGRGGSGDQGGRYRDQDGHQQGSQGDGRSRDDQNDDAVSRGRHRPAAGQR